MRRLVYLCLLLSAAANAQLVTIDAGAHPTGMDLYTVTPGAGVFSIANHGGCSPGTEYHNPLIVYFDVPTNFVEVRAHFLETMIDGAVLRAYNSAGTLLATCFIPGAGFPGKTFSCGEVVRRYEYSHRGHGLQA